MAIEQSKPNKEFKLSFSPYSITGLILECQLFLYACFGIQFLALIQDSFCVHFLYSQIWKTITCYQFIERRLYRVVGHILLQYFCVNALHRLCQLLIIQLPHFHPGLEKLFNHSLSKKSKLKSMLHLARGSHQNW